MVDSREAFYSTNVVMEVDAILYLNYTQDLKKKKLLPTLRMERQCAALGCGSRRHCYI